MLRNIVRTLEQMNDGPFLRVLLMSLGATIALMAVFGALAFWAGGMIPEFGWQWLNSLIDWVLGLGLVLGSIFLILPVSGLFIGLMLDPVAEAVEAKYYANGPAGRSQPFWGGIWTGVRFAFVVVAFNLGALIFYFLFVPLAPFIFLALNGYLLSREYFELAGHRFMPPAEVARLRRRHRLQVMAAGLPVAGLMLIPGVNLIAPLFGTALMVHEFRRLAAKTE